MLIVVMMGKWSDDSTSCPRCSVVHCGDDVCYVVVVCHGQVRRQVS